MDHLIIDVTTGEEERRPLTAAEVAQRKADAKAAEEAAARPDPIAEATALVEQAFPDADQRAAVLALVDALARR